MSVTTNQLNEGQPSEVEDLIRSIDEVPEISTELRSRILVATSQAALSARRQKGWVVASAFAAACAACVLIFAFFRLDAAADGTMAEDANPAYRAQETINDTINQRLQQQRDVISSGMPSPGISP